MSFQARLTSGRMQLPSVQDKQKNNINNIPLCFQNFGIEKYCAIYSGNNPDFMS